MPRLWDNLPPKVLRALIEELGEGILPISPTGDADGEPRTPVAAPDVRPVSERSANAQALNSPYTLRAGRQAPLVRAVSALLGKASAGDLTVTDLNRALDLLNVKPEIVERALAELGLDPRNPVILDTMYRLAGGRFCHAGRDRAEIRSAADHAEEKWLLACVAALTIGLIIAVLLRMR